MLIIGLFMISWLWDSKSWHVWECLHVFQVNWNVGLDTRRLGVFCFDWWPLCLNSDMAKLRNAWTFYVKKSFFLGWTEKIGLLKWNVKWQHKWLTDSSAVLTKTKMKAERLYPLEGKDGSWTQWAFEKNFCWINSCLFTCLSNIFSLPTRQILTFS